MIETMKKMMTDDTTIRTYSELIKLSTFQDRFNYLKLVGQVGEETFGSDRFINQTLYHSRSWKHARDIVIARDLGCDLALDGYEIHGNIYVHHMNPVMLLQVIDFDPDILNPEFLISCSYDTHQAIHFGSMDNLIGEPIVRTPNDMCPWKNVRRMNEVLDKV